MRTSRPNKEFLLENEEAKGHEEMVKGGVDTTLSCGWCFVLFSLSFSFRKNVNIVVYVSYSHPTHELFPNDRQMSVKMGLTDKSKSPCLSNSCCRSV